MEISNQTLAWVVVMAIAVSILGTGISLFKLGESGITGHATANATGNASVTISSVTALTFDVAAVNFGSGSVNMAYQTCNLTANDSTYGNLTAEGCEGFNTGAGQVYPLILENAGNTYLNVTLNFSGDNTTFPGSGIGSAFMFAISNNESGTCKSGLSNTSWTNVPALTLQNICQNMSWMPSEDTIKIGLHVRIPQSASGLKEVNITAQGTSL